MGAVFRYAASTLRADTDPTFALRGATCLKTPRRKQPLPRKRHSALYCGRSTNTRLANHYAPRFK
jgi:hypothetical protein